MIYDPRDSACVCVRPTAIPSSSSKLLTAGLGLETRGADPGETSAGWKFKLLVERLTND